MSNTAAGNIKLGPLSVTQLVKWAGIVALVIANYHQVLVWMYERFTAMDSYYSHGFMIPFVSLYLMWQKRQQLLACPPGWSWWGLVIVVIAILIHAAGTVFYIFSLSGFSLFTLIIGVCLFMQGGARTRVVLFPLLFLGFMFPLPMAVLVAVSLPLKALVARVGVWMVSVLGIPVFRDGVYVSLASGQLTVGDPCSGLRSLISFLALGCLYAYWSKLAGSKKFLLVVLTIPIAVLSNTIRVALLIAVAHFVGLDAASPDSLWHDGSGLFMFVVGLILLIITGKLLEWRAQPAGI